GRQPAKRQETVLAEPLQAQDVADVPAQIGGDELSELVHRTLKQIIVELLKVRLVDVDTDKEFIEFGFDSISFTSFSYVLNRQYELELMPTIFFEHSSVRRLAQYLLREAEEALAKKHRVDMTTKRQSEIEPTSLVSKERRAEEQKNKKQRGESSETKRGEEQA